MLASSRPIVVRWVASPTAPPITKVDPIKTRSNPAKPPSKTSTRIVKAPISRSTQFQSTVIAPPPRSCGLGRCRRGTVSRCSGLASRIRAVAVGPGTRDCRRRPETLTGVPRAARRARNRGASLMSLRPRLHLAALAIVLAAFLVPGRASAQYFGRNKVQYENFHFQVLATEHFDIHYYDEERPMAEQVGRMAERWYQRLATAMGE